MDFVVVLVVVAAVVAFLSAPLRTLRRADRTAEVELAELETAREAKYREIRDAELDHRTGKLSDSDYEAIDTALRAEAVEIMRALDAEAAHGGGDPAGAAAP